MATAVFPRVDASADALCLIREANISEADRLLIFPSHLAPPGYWQWLYWWQFAGVGFVRRGSGFSGDWCTGVVHMG